MICGGWFDEVLTYGCWSFRFLYSLYVPSNKSNVTSKKSTICKFVFISILKLAFLKISIMSFRIWSALCLDVFLESTSPTSLCKPVDYFSRLFDNKDRAWMPTTSQILAPSKLPMVKSKFENSAPFKNNKKKNKKLSVFVKNDSFRLSSFLPTQFF